MIFWMLAAMALYYVGLFLPSPFLMQRIGVMTYFTGARDDDPTPQKLHGRIKRAHVNLGESMPIFLALGVLALIVKDANLALATAAAMVFVIARAVYLPAYILGIPVLRSAIWSVGFSALLVMAYALI
ncbi:MAG: MAPEG family protein [Pseudomonadota bacterium]